MDWKSYKIFARNKRGKDLHILKRLHEVKNNPLKFIKSYLHKMMKGEH